MSDISTLPNEILEEIAQIAVEPAEDVYDTDTLFDRQDEIIKLSHVSRTLRYIIVNRPVFWTFISSLHPPEKVDAVLARSANMPLVINFGQPEQFELKRGPFEQFTERILTLCHRWRAIHVDNGYYLPGVFRLYPTLDLPQLERVLDFAGGLDSLDWMPPTWDTPNLVEVQVCGIVERALPPSVRRFDWNTEGADLSAVIDHLRPLSKHRNLTRLMMFIEDVGDPEYVRDPFEPLDTTLPYLRHLTLNLAMVPNLGCFIWALDLPALEELEILFEEPRYDDEDSSQLKELFDRWCATSQSYPNLQSFSITCRWARHDRKPGQWKIEDDDIETTEFPLLDSLLPRMPKLSVLCVDGLFCQPPSSVNDSWNDLQTLNALPPLRKITFKHCSSTELSHLMELVRIMQDGPSWADFETLEISPIQSCPEIQETEHLMDGKPLVWLNRP